jgi:hypothetical protein
MWMSSPAHLLWIPPDCHQEVRTAGEREMRGLYVAPRLARELPPVPVCVRVSPLARAYGVSPGRYAGTAPVDVRDPEQV